MFKSANITRAVGIPAPTLASWIDRRLIKLGPDDIDSNTGGVPRQFSRRRVDQIALTFELSNAGLSASAAATAAACFTDEASPGRAAGTLFAEGRTLLIVDEQGASVVNASDRDSFESAMQILFADARTVTVVNCNRVVDRVSRALAGEARKAGPAAQIYRGGRPMMAA